MMRLSFLVKIFLKSYKSLEAVIKKFTSETGNERFAFFKEGMFNAITGQNNGED